MSNKLTPHAVFGDITDITADWLAQNNILGLALDMDNTVARYSQTVPDAEVVDWLNALRRSGIAAVMVSNSHRPDRVAAVCAELNIPYTYRAAKPSPKGFAWAARTMNLPPQNVAAVGDQIFTDTWGGNRAGCKTLLVYPRGMSENLLFRLRRWAEKPFIKTTKKDMSI